jgi:glycosyltransferase involved in cell wall biosynthesis
MTDINFTLIIPTFNRPEQLIRCLQSLLDQTYASWQAIVVNDGSTANYETLDKFWQDSRINYIYLEANAGVNHARNHALSKINIKPNNYICFIDDDEYFISTALEIAHEILNKNFYQWLVLQCFLNDNKTTYMSKTGYLDYIDDYLYGKNLKKDATHFIGSGLARRANFSHFVKNGEEWVYFAKLARYTKFWATPIPVKYNIHQKNGLYLGNMHGKSLIKPYLMKWYRPYVALTLRPFNIKALTALLIQTVKLPFRSLQILYKLTLKILLN